MVLVFSWAARVFNEVSVGKELLLQTNPDDRTPLTAWAMRWLFLVSLLFVLGYIASLIAARGANLYSSIRSHEPQRKGGE